MNDKKIAFIICTNNELWYEECIKYLARLEVPEGYEVDLIKVTEARSMTAGYNEGMNATDAKYKIYLHQDVFIVQEDFVERMLKVFKEEPKIGIMGVMGADRIVPNGCYWNNWNCGQAYVFGVTQKGIVCHENKKGGSYTSAVALDGMLLMTQYDIPWREDLFQKWDFYDVSQCFEFKRCGYEVAVLLEEKSSVIHDCGYVGLMNYDEARVIFCEEYKEYGFDCGEVHIKDYSEVEQLMDEFLYSFDLIMKQNVDGVIVLSNQMQEAHIDNNTVAELNVICDIYCQEKKHRVPTLFMQKGDTAEGLIEKYTRYKFLIRDVELGITEDAKKELREVLQKQEISDVAFAMLGKLGTCDWDSFMQVLMKVISYA